MGLVIGRVRAHISARRNTDHFLWEHVAFAAVLLPALLGSSGCGMTAFERAEIRTEFSAIREMHAEFTALRAELNVAGDVAGIKSSVGGDAVGIKTTTTQTAHGDINDAWALRLAVLGGPASTLTYVFVVRPLRRRLKCLREKRPAETVA